MRIALLCMMLVVPVTVAWADTMRCGDRLVSDGDLAVEVLAVCGAPDHRVRNRRHGPAADEDWTYDFGPNRFLQVLRFRDGELVSIRSAGYGFDTADVDAR